MEEPRWDNTMTKMMAGHDEGADVDVTEELYARAAANLDLLAFVGLASRFDDSAELFCRTLGCRAPAYRPGAARVHRAQGNTTEMTASGRLQFEATNRWDLRLYSRVVELFEVRAAALV